MPYEALDFYDVDSLLTDEERMVRDMVRDFVDEEVIPKIEHACRDGVFLDEWRVALGEMGVLGALNPINSDARGPFKAQTSRFFAPIGRPTS